MVSLSPSSSLSNGLRDHNTFRQRFKEHQEDSATWQDANFTKTGHMLTAALTGLSQIILSFPCYSVISSLKYWWAKLRHTATMTCCWGSWCRRYRLAHTPHSGKSCQSLLFLNQPWFHSSTVIYEQDEINKAATVLTKTANVTKEATIFL